jgi:hypothetical protein
LTPGATGSSPPFDPVLTVNAENRTIDLLSNDIVWSHETGCCRFSEDGQLLRYAVGQGDYGAMTVTLRERVLSTGEERILNNVSGDSLTLDSNTYGTRWLLLDDSYNDLDRVRTYRMLCADGKDELIYQEEFSYSYAHYEILERF